MSHLRSTLAGSLRHAAKAVGTKMVQKECVRTKLDYPELCVRDSKQSLTKSVLCSLEECKMHESSAKRRSCSLCLRSQRSCMEWDAGSCLQGFEASNESELFVSPQTLEG